MAHLTIIGSGTTGQAIAGVAGKGGHTVQLLASGDANAKSTLAASEKVSWTGGFGIVA